jgi:hypothetical protein
MSRKLQPLRGRLLRNKSKKNRLLRNRMRKSRLLRSRHQRKPHLK